MKTIKVGMVNEILFNISEFVWFARKTMEKMFLQISKKRDKIKVFKMKLEHNK